MIKFWLSAHFSAAVRFYAPFGEIFLQNDKPPWGVCPRAVCLRAPVFQISCCSLMMSLNCSPKVSAALRQRTMRLRKISK